MNHDADFSVDYQHRLRFTRDDAVVVLDPGALHCSRSVGAARRLADRTRLADWLVKRTELPEERVAELLARYTDESDSKAAPPPLESSSA